METIDNRYCRSARAMTSARSTQLAMAVRTVAALFRTAIETIRVGYWKIASRAAMNDYYCCGFHRVALGLRRNVDNIATLDDAVAAFILIKLVSGKTIIRVPP
jgi:hypothetical protein